MAFNNGRFFPVQAIHIGFSGADYKVFSTAALGFDGTPASGFGGPFAGMLGSIFEDRQKVFRLVQYHKGTNSIAVIDGGVVYWKDKANSVVTPDTPSSEAGADAVAGGTHVALAAATDHLKYFFIQLGGDQAAVQVAALAVAGDHLTGHATTNNILTRTAAGTASPDLQAATALSTRGTTTTDEGASLANSSKVRWILGNLL